MIAVKVLEEGPVKFIGNGRLPTHVLLPFFYICYWVSLGFECH